MEVFVNDRSLHGQFPDIESFRVAIRRLMQMRQVAERHGRSLHCHRSLAMAAVTPNMSMPEAVQYLTPGERTGLLVWLAKRGPFWEDIRLHPDHEWLEHRGDIVTDNAIGEAAWCMLHDTDRSLVSLQPSEWMFTPVSVEWRVDDAVHSTVSVPNYWEPGVFDVALKAVPAAISSWREIAALAPTRWPYLTFAEPAFDPLDGHPFVAAAGARLLFLLDTLNRLKTCFGADGKRTEEGHDIYQDFFTGAKGKGGRGAMFSDSSDDEKRTFAAELLFKHPGDPTKSLLCSWHGKVQTPPLRIHFSWPMTAEEPTYVVYVGPKLTKR